MTKPILWLGPLEEIDAEFDPLLGRSAKDIVAQSPSLPSKPLEANRSVFDDPIAGPADMAEPVTQTQSNQPAQDDGNIAGMDDIPASAETDLTPEVTPEVTSQWEPDPVPAVSPPAREPFLSRLFGRKTAAAEDTTFEDGRSINDIWAKAEPIPEPQPAEATQNLTPDKDEEVTTSPETEPVVEPVSDLGHEAQIDHVKDEAPVDLVEDRVEDEDKGLALTDLEEIDPVSDGEADLPDAAQTEAADEPEASATPIEEVPEIASGGVHAFQKAFNAEQFWKLEQAKTKPDALEADGDVGIEDTAEANLAPVPRPVEPSAPETPEAIEVEQTDVAPIEAAPASEIENAGEPFLAAAPAPMRRKKRRKKAKKSYVGAFLGTFFFGTALMMTLISSAADLGYPFDLMSSYRWYWVFLAVVAAGIFGVTRGWLMVLASFGVMGLNLFVTIPASGDEPVGGKTATAVIGWANVSGQPEALAEMFKQADQRQVSLMMIAQAPSSVLTPPAGWTLIEAPLAGDPTAIAVLSKGSWRAATVPGEPTMARPAAGDLTIIGVHPQDALKGRRSTPKRDELINRAGTRAGIQTGPTIVLGDFNAAPWDRAMRRFREFGNVERVRCGGFAGGTYSQAFGLVGVATDHAYVRDVRVTHCRLGATLPGGPHKPIWLYVSPQVTEPPAQQ
jgi:hypothetical protein